MRRPIKSASTIGVACAMTSIALAQGKVETTTKTVEVKKVVVQAKAAAVPPVAVALAAGDPQVQQWVQQFRPLVRAEFAFIRTVCAPTPDQRKLIARDGERALVEAAKQFAQAQRGGIRFINGRADYPDSRKTIQDAMAKSVAAHLPPDRAAKLRSESEKRAADRKEAALHNIVAKLDRDLDLEAAQREKIAASLASHWDDSWGRSLEAFLYGDDYVPRPPNNLVTPFLDEARKKILESSQNNQHFFMYSFQLVGNNMGPEDPVADKELIEARQEVQAEARGKAAEVEVQGKGAAPAAVAPVRDEPAPAPAPF